jgi:hypothetical protein
MHEGVFRIQRHRYRRVAVQLVGDSLNLGVGDGHAEIVVRAKATGPAPVKWVDTIPMLMWFRWPNKKDQGAPIETTDAPWCCN